MYKQIWKYDLETRDSQIIRMPKDAQILCVQIQFAKPRIWALVDPKQPFEDRHILIFGTGHPVFQECLYIGTFQIRNGDLVFHVFEQK